MEPMKTSEVLDRAADLLERDGWCQGALHDSAGRMCAVGALRRAIVVQVDLDPSTLGQVDEVEEAARRRLMAVADPRGWVGAGGVPDWNDREGRTFQDVLDTFRKAAKNARLDEENT